MRRLASRRDQSIPSTRAPSAPPPPWHPLQLTDLCRMTIDSGDWSSSHLSYMNVSSRPSRAARKTHSLVPDQHAIIVRRRDKMWLASIPLDLRGSGYPTHQLPSRTHSKRGRTHNPSCTPPKPVFSLLQRDSSSHTPSSDPNSTPTRPTRTSQGSLAQRGTS